MDSFSFLTASSSSYGSPVIGRAHIPSQCPVVDLRSFFAGDSIGTMDAMIAIDDACKNYGFFQVINHSVPFETIISPVHVVAETFFSLHLFEKAKAKANGWSSGYSFSHKMETISFKSSSSRYTDSSTSRTMVKDYFANTLGRDFQLTGEVCQDYAVEMNKLAMSILELFGKALKKGKNYFAQSYLRNDSLMSLSRYPICQESVYAARCAAPCIDQTSLTIFHQYKGGNLQVFVDEQWHNVTLRSDALTIFVGIKLSEWTNGIYRNCPYRSCLIPYEKPADEKDFWNTNQIVYKGENMTQSLEYTII